MNPIITSLPWRVGDAGHTVFGPKTAAPSPKTVASGLSKADSAFVVRAINSHSALVHALRECRQELMTMGSEFDGLVRESTDALKLAGEEI